MKRLLVLALVVSANCPYAQRLTGRVLAAHSGTTSEPLPGATVVWKDTRSGAVCDENGDFALAVPPGAVWLIASYSGYVSDTLEYTGQPHVEIVLNEITQDVVEIIGEQKSTELSMMDPLKFQTLVEKELCKAACCNLSESFETNASIDASYTDAVTGTRQIRMLGLDGRYTQILFDNIPAVRGLASIYGLTYVPGPFIHSIQIAKGVGSVTSGYESITGQINVSHKAADNGDKFFLNGYANNSGRVELNAIKSIHAGKYLSSTLMGHAALSEYRSDMNGDGFLDNPLFKNLILRNQWNWHSQGGWGGEYQITYLQLSSTSGQEKFDPHDEALGQLWGVHTTTGRAEVSAKTGYVFPDKQWKSFGSQVSGSMHDQRGEFGLRSYTGKQQSGRINLLFATRLFNDENKITSGVSFLYDKYIESLDTLSFNRTERVPGMFTEYTFLHKNLLAFVFGLRADLHNTYGLLITPRVHFRYSLTEHLSIKGVAGKGYRTSSLIMDNVGMLASNRTIHIQVTDPEMPYGLKMEEAWNFGLLFAGKFTINHRDASVSVDAFYTTFTEQVVADFETPTDVRFYNLTGRSYSTSAQAEFQWSPVRRLDCRLAYRWLDARTQYDSLLLERPLVNRHRAFTNVAYETRPTSKNSQWKFDATLQWISSKRIPFTGTNPEGYQLPERSEPYVQLAAQVTRVVAGNFDIYCGGENLTGFMQHHPIIAHSEPFSPYFDASLVWGPVFGRMVYLGFRWHLKSDVH